VREGHWDPIVVSISIGTISNVVVVVVYTVDSGA